MFVTWFKNPKASKPALDPGSPAQASLSTEPLPPKRSRSTYSTARPEGSLVFRSSGLPWDPDPCEPTFRSENHPMFCGPSWGNCSCVPLRSPPPTRSDGSRVALEAITSSGASSRLTPKEPESPSNCLPAEIGPLVTCRPKEAGTAVPITAATCTSPPSRGSEKYGLKPVDNGDIGNNPGNLLATRSSIPPRLPFRSARPTSGGCLNRQN